MSDTKPEYVYTVSAENYRGDDTGPRVYRARVVRGASRSLLLDLDDDSDDVSNAFHFRRRMPADSAHLTPRAAITAYRKLLRARVTELRAELATAERNLAIAPTLAFPKE